MSLDDAPIVTPYFALDASLIGVLNLSNVHSAQGKSPLEKTAAVKKMC